MALTTSRGRTTSELQIPKKWKDSSETSPERNRVWTEPYKNTEKKVPVVYYLSRNGQLEHPHFMEIPLASPEGLFLRGKHYKNPLLFFNLILSGTNRKINIVANCDLIL